MLAAGGRISLRPGLNLKPQDCRASPLTTGLVPFHVIVISGAVVPTLERHLVAALQYQDFPRVIGARDR